MLLRNPGVAFHTQSNAIQWVKLTLMVLQQPYSSLFNLNACADFLLGRIDHLPAFVEQTELTPQFAKLSYLRGQYYLMQ